MALLRKHCVDDLAGVKLFGVVRTIEDKEGFRFCKKSYLLDMILCALQRRKDPCVRSK